MYENEAKNKFNMELIEYNAHMFNHSTTHCLLNTFRWSDTYIRNGLDIIVSDNGF